MFEILTIQEVADLLKLHPRTVMKMAAAGEIPSAKVGRKWRFDRRLVEQWLAVRMGNGWAGSHPPEGQAAPSKLLASGRTLILNSSVDRRGVLEALAGAADHAGLSVSREELLTLLEEREAMFPTAMESGVAFPHPRHPLPELDRPMLSLLIVDQGVAFGQAKDEPTYVFVLVCSPDDRTHVHLLAQLARIFRRGGIVSQLRRCGSPQQAIEIIRNAEKAALAEGNFSDGSKSHDRSSGKPHRVANTG